MGLAVDGLATGLDTTNIIAKLLEIEKRPIAKIEKQQTKEVSKLNAWAELGTKLSSLKSITESIDTLSEFSGISASFTNSSSTATQTVLTASATSSASSATYTINVTALAKSEKNISQGFSSKSEAFAGDGTISITVGSTTTSVPIDSTNNTLEGIKKAINNSNSGVTASIIDDGDSNNPYRLLITANESGSSNTVTIADTIMPISIGSSVPGALFSFTETQAASNATFTLDGVTVTKSSNVISDAIEGVTLNLKGIGSGTIKLESDFDSAKKNITDFVSSFNEVQDFVHKQFLLKSDTGETGTLFGNNSLINIQRKLRGIVNDKIPGSTGTYNYLSQIGVRTNSEGKLVINSSELSDALKSDFSGVINLFVVSADISNSSVAYNSKTVDTKGGTYEIQISSGTAQIREQGSSEWIDMSGSGNFWKATSGNATGLQIRVNSLSDGSYGTISLSTGAADKLSVEANFLTDKTYKGMIFTEEEFSRKSIKDMQDQIDKMNFRIKKKETSLRDRYASLEASMGKLQSEKNYLTQQLTSLNKA